MWKSYSTVSVLTGWLLMFALFACLEDPLPIIYHKAQVPFLLSFMWFLESMICLVIV
jgi:hypothetical protein